MLHLPSERLAAIADDEPTAAEALHLANCTRCAGERRSYSKLIEAARALRNADAAPVTDWTALKAGLAAEGLLRTRVTSRRVRTFVNRAGMLAASLALLAGGVAAGRYSAGVPLLPLNGASSARMREVVIDEPRDFTSTAEALDVYFRSQQEIQRSAAYLAANGEQTRGGSQSSVLARLAALEEIFSVTQAGLRDAPTDPVLNDYYASVVGAREAARHQLNAVPVGLLRRGY